MRPKRLLEALENLSKAMVEVNDALDALASHIFTARRNHRLIVESDTKGGKRSERTSRLSWQKACDLGFRGQLGDWQQLLGARPRN